MWEDLSDKASLAFFSDHPSEGCSAEQETPAWEWGVASSCLVDACARTRQLPYGYQSVCPKPFSCGIEAFVCMKFMTFVWSCYLPHAVYLKEL